MAHYIQETYAPPQSVDVTSQKLCNRGFQQHHHNYVEPVIQQHQMHIDPTVQEQIYTEPNIQQHHIYQTRKDIIPQYTQINREQNLQQCNQIYCTQDIQQHNFYREVYLEKQLPPQPATQTHVCNICNKTCWSKDDLEAHYAGHTGEKAHICNVCHKSFTRKSRLQAHSLIHTIQTSHVCDLCQKGFYLKNKLKRHYLTHTGHKAHLCKVCNRSLANKDSLKKHSLIHTGHKPHLCNICQRGFVQKTTLQNHYMTHTGEKNHICEICNKSFSRKSLLRTHYRLHSTDLANKKGKDQEDQIIIYIAEPKAVMEEVPEAVVGQQQQELDMDQQGNHIQEDPDYSEITFAKNSNSHQHALLHTEQQVHLENAQTFAIVYQPLIHMDLASNIDVQGLLPLLTVNQQGIAYLGCHGVQYIGHQALDQISHQTFTVLT